MKKIITFFILLITLFTSQMMCSAELLYKLKPLKFDTSSALLFIPVQASAKSNISNNLKITKQKENNSVTIDISSATTFAQPNDLFFSEGRLKEVQINTKMDNTVTYTLFFNDNYNISNLKITNVNNNLCIAIKPLQPYGMNYYLNTYSEDTDATKDYKENLTVTSKEFQTSTPVANTKANKNTLNEINKAFVNSNYQSAEVYTNYEITNETQNHVLRSKYYINNLTTNGRLFTVSGVGILSFEKQFLLSNPTRMVFDIPNSITKSELHNKELTLANGDTVKIAQFSPTTTRLVVTSKDAPQYIPVYFSDSQKAIITSPKNLMTSDLPAQKTNIVKSTYQKAGEYSNLLFEFDKPLVYSIKRTSDKLYVYFLNAEKFNESNFNTTIKSTPYSQSVINIMKNTGLRLSFPMANKSDLTTYISPEGRVFKISFKEVKPKPAQTIVKSSETNLQKTKKKEGTIISTPKYHNPKGSRVIVLDAGHGGKDVGCTRDGIYEKDITLDVCDRLQSVLQKRGFKVYMTRTNDVYVSLEDRSLFNQSINPAIFVSVHVNSCNDASPKGIETHYYTEESMSLGSIVNKTLAKKVPYTTNRGLLRSRFYVINHTAVPAILVEIGFISNPEERKSLTTPQRKQQTAEGIADGIVEYFNTKK